MMETSDIFLSAVTGFLLVVIKGSFACALSWPPQRKNDD